MIAALEILQGDAAAVLRTLPDASVHCCVTSPPYWGLRDYGHDGQMGLESTPDEYVANMVAVFREVRRVLRSDGTCWLNLGDSYFNTNPGSGGDGSKSGLRKDGRNEKSRIQTAKLSISHQTFAPVENMGGPVGVCKENLVMGGQSDSGDEPRSRQERLRALGLKPKDLVGIPWRVAFALQADGWYLRQDIIWHKPNPMPESVVDRCTKAHEYLFLLSKSQRYFYDADAVKEPCSDDMQRRAAKGHTRGAKGKLDASRQDADTLRGEHAKVIDVSQGRNRRSVWTVATKPYAAAHFATFPPDLIRPCVRAGCPVGGTVLDPFAGSGTTGMVALEEGRRAILIELNAEYIRLIEKRCTVTQGLAL